MCQPCIEVIENKISRLTLKGELFSIVKPAKVEDIEEVFKQCNLYETLSSHDNLSNLRNRPKLKLFYITAAESEFIFSIYLSVEVPYARFVKNQDCVRLIS